MSLLTRPEGASERPAQQLLSWHPPWTSHDGPEACSPPSECLISEDTRLCFRGSAVSHRVVTLTED